MENEPKNYRYFQLHETEITHFKGSGPGGQNRNKRMTGVRVVHLPTQIVAVATERRSQSQNLAAALERLDEKLRQHFFRPKKRAKSLLNKSSREKRLTSKRNVASKKEGRRKVFRDD